MKNLKFINKFIKADDSGRSMVEMLGVLAIVGVISVGGIAGYIYGMNRYRTNEILDGASKRAVVVAGQIALEIEPNLTEFVDYDETAGGTFSSDVIRWENEFGIQVSGVKKEVCENLIRMIGDNTPLRSITTIDDPETDLITGGCAEGTDNDLYLVYNLEMLSNKAVDSGSRSGESGEEQPQTVDCSLATPNGGYCRINGQVVNGCINLGGTCVPKSECHKICEYSTVDGSGVNCFDDLPPQAWNACCGQAGSICTEQ